MYLGAFGPATAKDIASSTGLPAGELAPALASLELRGFRSTGGEALLDLPRAPLPDPDTPGPRPLPPQPRRGASSSSATRRNASPRSTRSGTFR